MSWRHSGNLPSKELLLPSSSVEVGKPAHVAGRLTHLPCVLKLLAGAFGEQTLYSRAIYENPARAREEHRTGASADITPSSAGRKCLFLWSAEEEVVGRVRHQRLLTHIGGDGATGSWSRSPVGIQTLDEAGLREEFTAGWPLVTPDYLE